MFTTTPHGYVPSGRKGWVVPARSPQKGKLDKLTKENAEMKERLEALEALLLKGEE